MHAVLNNAATHHFQKLAHHVMALLEKLERQPQASQQAANAVYFLRLIVKHLTENLSAAQLVGFVNGERLANGSAASHVAAGLTRTNPLYRCLSTAEDFLSPHSRIVPLNSSASFIQYDMHVSHFVQR